MKSLPFFRSGARAARPRRCARAWGAAVVSVASMAALVAGLALIALPAEAQVGQARLQVGTMAVTMVYPTDEPAREVAQGPFTVKVAPDAAPLPGRRRLIVMSHGTAGSPVADHDLAATLARAGFVVAQPEHPGDNFRDSAQAGPDAWITRPGDVSRVIDQLAADARWQALLKFDRVGVHGMSAGGATALSLAGGQWRTLDLVRHCLDHEEADFGFCYNGLPDAAQQAQRRKRFEAARGVPEMFLPSDIKTLHGGRTPARPGDDPRPDPRVAAVTLAVPVAAIFTAESLKRIAIPVGVIVAQGDRMLLPEFHARRVLREVPQARLLGELRGAGHMDLLSPWPEAAARGAMAAHPRGAALEPGFDATERTRAFEAVAVFFQRQLGP